MMIITVERAFKRCFHERYDRTLLLDTRSPPFCSFQVCRLSIHILLLSRSLNVISQVTCCVKKSASRCGRLLLLTLYSLVNQLFPSGATILRLSNHCIRMYQYRPHSCAICRGGWNRAFCACYQTFFDKHTTTGRVSNQDFSRLRRLHPVVCCEGGQALPDRPSPTLGIYYSKQGRQHMMHQVHTSPEKTALPTKDAVA